MAKVRTTLTIDEDVLRAVKVQAARSGMGDSEAIEQSVRRDLGLDLLARMWSKANMEPEAAMELAVAEQRATRRANR
jgi:hypothetical protein